MYNVIETIMEAFVNKMDLFNNRKDSLLKATSDIREKLATIIDENSFVELNAFSFSKNEFFDEELQGLGVLTGYATINDYPVYVVAQNGKLLNGGLSKANCDKIASCLEKAIGTKTPVVYLLDSQGVQVGEGVAVLESIANVLSLSNELRGTAPQIAIAVGDVLGSLALLANNCDFTYVVNNACISYASPQVISASTKDGVTNEVIGGSKSKNGVKTFAVKELANVKDNLTKLFGVLPDVSSFFEDNDDDYNRSCPSLNKGVSVDSLISAVYDKNTFIKMYEGYADEVVVGIGRIGGYSIASIIFDGGEEGVELTLDNVLKIKKFANFTDENNMPLITFVNAKGIKKDLSTSNTQVMAEIMNMLYALENTTRISVVYGKAIGLGYTCFASRKFGNAYTYAFCNSKISLLDGVEGASATFGIIDSEKLSEVNNKYEEMQDSFNAAKLGCVDNIIEPQFVRQYILSALQTFIR